jgi:hypothetical protein
MRGVGAKAAVLGVSLVLACGAKTDLSDPSSELDSGAAAGAAGLGGRGGAGGAGGSGTESIDELIDTLCRAFERSGCGYSECRAQWKQQYVDHAAINCGSEHFELTRCVASAPTCGGSLIAHAADGCFVSARSAARPVRSSRWTPRVSRRNGCGVCATSARIADFRWASEW